jgi:membrane protein
MKKIREQYARLMEKVNTFSNRRRLRSLVIPGFEGVPLWDVILKFREEIQDDALALRAASVSYFFIIAIFPTIIFFFSLIPYIPVQNFDITLMRYMQQAMPESVFLVLESTIQDIVSIQRGGLTSLNFFLAFIFSSNGVSSMMQAFDKMNPTFVKRNFFQKKWVSIKITFLLTIQVIAAIVLIIFGEKTLKDILGYLHITSIASYWLIVVFKYLFVTFSFFNSIALIYYFGPSVKVKYRYFSVGATFATIMLILLSYLLRVYFNIFSDFNQLYGSLGIVIVVMLWVYLNAFVLLFGFELNNSIAVNKIMQQKKDASNI